MKAYLVPPDVKDVVWGLLDQIMSKQSAASMFVALTEEEWAAWQRVQVIDAGGENGLED